MSHSDSLKVALSEVLQVISPLNEDWEARFRILNEIREAISSVDTLRGAIVEPFGSFASNLFTRWGDLDISVELPNGSYISSASKKHKQQLLGDILRALRQNGGWHKLQFIPHARVPLVKSVSNRQSISCDISIDNLAGFMKSRFLLWISEIDGRFRDMILLVKEWASAHDINSSRTGTLNSYSLSLLVIFHFQTCVPAILPPLQEIYPGNMVDELAGVRDDVLRRISDTCAARLACLKSDKSRTINRSSLSELFISFFAKFSDLSSKASQQGICPYRGQWEDIESNTRWLPKTSAIFIEDPLEQPVNTARSVKARKLKRISEAFQITHLNLSSVSQSPISILATIATQKTSRSVETNRENHRSQNGYARPRTTIIKQGSNVINLGHNSAARTSTSDTRQARNEALTRTLLSDPGTSYRTNHQQVHHAPPNLHSAQQQGMSSRPGNSFNSQTQVRSNGAEQKISNPGPSYRTNHQQVHYAPPRLYSAQLQVMSSWPRNLYNSQTQVRAIGAEQQINNPGTSYRTNHQQVHYAPSHIHSAQRQGMSSRPGNSLNLRAQVRSNGSEQKLWRPKS